ncbi:hypothetical protein ACQX46_11950, partial [Corynebacterium diphtheriae]
DYERECLRVDRLHTDDNRKDHLKRQRAKEGYARHYPNTYDHPSLMPGWAMLEELTLGDSPISTRAWPRTRIKKPLPGDWGSRATRCSPGFTPDHCAKHVRPSLKNVESATGYSS